MRSPFKFIITFFIAASTTLFFLLALPTDVVRDADLPLSVGFWLVITVILIILRCAMSEPVSLMVAAARQKLRPATPLSTSLSADGDIKFANFALATFLERRQSVESMNELLGAMLDPSGSITRVTEHVRASDDEYEQRITRSIVFAHPEAECLVPVVPLIN